MFGTLVIQLPSVYEGAELRVYNPSLPNESLAFDFSTSTADNAGLPSATKMQTRKRSRTAERDATDALLRQLYFSAFYADCYHEVSPLVTGSRLVLVYNLTARPPPRNVLSGKPEDRADPIAVSESLHQPPDARLLSQIARELRRWETETDEAYPDFVRTERQRYESAGVEHHVPVKLAAILSHFYTPASLRGVNSLKGRDRVVGRLLHDALKCRHDAASMPSLAALSADVLLSADVPEFAKLDADAPSRSVVASVIKEAAEPNVNLAPLDFDAFLSFVAL